MPDCQAGSLGPSLALVIKEMSADCLDWLDLGGWVSRCLWCKREIPGQSSMQTDLYLLLNGQRIKNSAARLGTCIRSCYMPIPSPPPLLENQVPQLFSQLLGKWMMQVDMVLIPGTDGDFGVLPGHVPTVSQLKPGVMSVHKDDKDVVKVCIRKVGHICLPQFSGEHELHWQRRLTARLFFSATGAKTNGMQNTKGQPNIGY